MKTRFNDYRIVVGRESGFTLLELMLAFAVGSVVILGTVQVGQWSLKSLTSASDQATDAAQQELAHLQLKHDLELAGPSFGALTLRVAATGSNGSSANGQLNFFDSDPEYSGAHPERAVTISKTCGSSAPAGAVDQLILAVSHGSRVVYDPRRAYSCGDPADSCAGRVPASGTPELAFQGLDFLGALSGSTSEVYKTLIDPTSGSLVMLSGPTRYYTDGADVPARSSYYFSHKDALKDAVGGMSPNDVIAALCAGDSACLARFSFNGTLPLEPSVDFGADRTPDGFIRKLPALGGAGSFFHAQSFDFVRYSAVCEQSADGAQVLSLYRTQAFCTKSECSFRASDQRLVQKGLKRLELSRASVNAPLIEYSLVTQ